MRPALAHHTRDAALPQSLQRLLQIQMHRVIGLPLRHRDDFNAMGNQGGNPRRIGPLAHNHPDRHETRGFYKHAGERQSCLRIQNHTDRRAGLQTGQTTGQLRIIGEHGADPHHDRIGFGPLDMHPRRPDGAGDLQPRARIPRRITILSARQFQ